MSHQQRCERFDFLLALTLLLALAAMTAAGVSLRSIPQIPACMEDAVVIGFGDFDHGRWSEYTCGPALDDYTEGS
jgi:hypothetical protein